MTPRQRDTLDFISDHWETKRCAPIYDEMAEHLGLAAKSGAKRIVDALSDRGFVEYRAGCARSVELTEKGREHVASQRR